MPTNVVLVDFRTSPASPAELSAVASALTKQALEHFAVPPPKGWGLSALVTAAVPSAIEPGDWVMGLFDHPDQPGALGYHDRTKHGQPLMKVFPALCEQDGVKWSSCASHELLETLADPETCRSVQDKHGNFWALEVCDAVEAESYDIDGVTVSDFVTPAYFEPSSSRLDEQGKPLPLDYLRKVHTPYALRPGGYNQVYVPGQGWTQKTAETAPRAYRQDLPGRRARRLPKL